MYYWNKDVELSELVGKKLTEVRGIEQYSDEVRFFTECGEEYLFHHDQDCCESVRLEDFEAGHDDFVGATVLSAEEVSSDGAKSPYEDSDWEDSYTWTFYKIETDKGEIFMRWLGTSNGYYSESVDFVWANKPDEED